MMLIPLTDASRRPTRVPVVTATLIALNALMFVLELAGGASPLQKRCAYGTARCCDARKYFYGCQERARS